MKSVATLKLSHCTRGHPSAWLGWTKTGQLIQVNVALSRRHYAGPHRRPTMIRQYATDVTITPAFGCTPGIMRMGSDVNGCGLALDMANTR